eukprot:TRINITY_DN18719_c0_g1::TRINITY_DN18719_c0_g1_i1::g.20371::m.20371 TRINITY_DN18719_c0_g1::TRINITY_DN18719_c0_g1_i1::g.20371  ORF type:complete len:623 (+),score=179.65,sp/O88487/DC1I2_MOUSE/33.52/1e-81,WD40/PF00400.27/71,WD40/PF00400.27/5.5e+03,WD40/PF00400.27/2.6,WD40/PF00400.27/38,WD40/PF00400.27/3.1e-08,WD40/PF00400.27/31,WD40/PF00400.27/0.23,PQQ_3/PF13570.1/1.5e+02,PQQ_3/PF13570.1/2.4e+03,PQQ_3/PF13570.1/0.14,PQQ_3/PF13570.1/3.2e+02,NSP11/PF06471.7/0.054 TRINITY_DN18719_c0_g1_i1:17-1885(+)
MDAEQRKLEIAQKRLRLEELRRQKAEKEKKEVEHVPVASQPAPTPAPGPESIEDFLRQVAPPVLEQKEPKKPQRQPRLTLLREPIADVDIPPEETTCFEKDVQTDDYLLQTAVDSEDEDMGTAKPAQAPAKPTPETAVEAAPQEDKASLELKDMPEEDSRKVMGNPDFLAFLCRTTVTMDRALNAPADIFTNYADVVKTETKTESVLRKTRTFRCPKQVKSRCVTDINFSPKSTHFFVASYANSEEFDMLNFSSSTATDGSDGVVLLWNVNYDTMPDHIFHCESPVLSTLFDVQQPHLIYGATYAGQIVAWDTRVGQDPVNKDAAPGADVAKKLNERLPTEPVLPVSTSPFSPNCHVYPVYGLHSVGNRNASLLYSGSIDGQLCMWSPGFLAKPEATRNIKTREGQDVNITCLGGPEGEAGYIYSGGEDGNVYCFERANGTMVHRYDGHNGPITSLHFHPPPPESKGEASEDFSHLFLSSSMDWTVSLWSTKAESGHKAPLGRLYTFEDGVDYVFDARWSPTHPALFATADGTGTVTLRDLNWSIDMKRYELTVDEHGHALNRLRWTNDGTKIVTGGASGEIYLLDVSPELSSAESGSRFRERLRDLETKLTQDRDASNTDR